MNPMMSSGGGMSNSSSAAATASQGNVSFGGINFGTSGGVTGLIEKALPWAAVGVALWVLIKKSK